MEKETKKYMGVIDCHGIESFLPHSGDKESAETFNMMNIRAMANRQRHAMIYQVNLTEDQAGVIESLMIAGNYAGALHALKVHPLMVLPEQMKSLDLIPSPKLDPWG